MCNRTSSRRGRKVNIEKYDKKILKEVQEVCKQSQLHQLGTRQIILNHCDTDVIQEGVFIETGKVLLGDIVKNLLSSGAVFLSGGLAGDTAVDLMYAIERTATVVNAYNAIKEAGHELSEFLRELDRLKLEGNLEQITSHTERILSMLASKVDTVGTKGSAVNLSSDLTEYSQVLADEFNEFFKITAKSMSTWISTIIPDDGGNIGTFINVTLIGIVESAMDRPLDTFRSVIQQLPKEYQPLVFDEAALTEFLTDVCTKIADGVEGHGGGLVGNVLRGANTTSQYYFDFLGDYTPLGYVYDAGGSIGKKAGELIGGEDSFAAKAGESIFDPRAKAKYGRENIDALLEKFPVYIRDELIPQIPEAVKTYSQFMKYVISFLHLLELVRTGKLEVIASAENYEQYLPTGDEDQQALVAEIRRSLARHQQKLIG